MKANSHGYFPYKNIKLLCDTLGYKSTKTFYAHLKELKKLGVVYINSKRKCVCVRSFAYVSRKLNFRGKSGFLLYHSDIINYREYALAAIWGNLNRISKYRAKANNGAFLRHGGFSLSYIGNRLHKAKSTIYKNRKRVEKLGILKTRNRLTPVCSLIEANQYRSLLDDSRGYVVFNNQLCKQEVNYTSVFVYFRKKRNQ